MYEMKQCPFCGETGPVKIVIRKGKDGWRDRYCVRCDYDDGGCGSESGWYHSEYEAVESWNKRIQKPKPQGQWVHEKISSNKSGAGFFLSPYCSCSNCGIYVREESSFCPGCGADMRWR